MKKIIIIFSLVLIVGFISGCGWRENLLAPPDEYTVPEGSKVAECNKDEDIYKFIYKDDGVYLYFINDIEQNEDSVDYLIEQAYLNGSSVENYLAIEFPNSCVITNYISDEE